MTPTLRYDSCWALSWINTDEMAINAVALTFQVLYIPFTILSYITMEKLGGY